MQFRPKKTKERNKNNRINIVLAVIFLFAVSIVAKLYFLQIAEGDEYAAKASGQHRFSAVLEPQRGKIFLADSLAGEGKLFPAADNKKFAEVFAVPKSVKNAPRLAAELYHVFKKEAVEKEVEYIFAKEDEAELKAAIDRQAGFGEAERPAREAEARKNFAALREDPMWLELRKLKKDEEIGKRQEAAIGEYLKILAKENDPYELLEKKVEEETVRKLFAILSYDYFNQIENEAELAGASTTIAEGIASDKLEIVNDSVFYAGADGRKKELKIDGINFRMLFKRYYPEDNIGAHVLGFVGFAENGETGRYGLEEFFNNELSGRPGMVRSERGAAGDVVIVNDREVREAVNGADLSLTINHAIQFAACDKLNRAVLRHGADGGSVIVIKPETGAILAMCSAPDFSPNRFNAEDKLSVFNNPAIFYQYEPGSIFKVITMAMGLDEEAVGPDTTFNDTGRVQIAGYAIENSDHKANGVVTMTNVLEKSLNTGAIHVMRKIGADDFKKYVLNFGFGEKTGIELMGESKGDIRNLDYRLNRELYSATASFGQGVSVTPLQIANAFATIANGGIMMKPYIVKEIIKNDGARETTQPRQIRRVISERAATLLGGMMVNVVENGHGQRASVKGYYVAGKTGTAQIPRKDGKGYEANAHIGSFAGFAPANEPAFAMLVRIDHPRDVEWAESSAAPLFGELADFILNYYQIPPERTIEEKKK